MLLVERFFATIYASTYENTKHIGLVIIVFIIGVSVSQKSAFIGAGSLDNYTIKIFVFFVCLFVIPLIIEQMSNIIDCLCSILMLSSLNFTIMSTDSKGTLIT